MKSKFVVSLFAFLALLAGVAQAQDHSKVDIFAGYSYDRWDRAKKFNLNGGSASVAYNVNNWLSGVADFGGYHNTNILNTGLDFTLSTYLFGPRISYRGRPAIAKEFARFDRRGLPLLDDKSGATVVM